MGTNNFCQNCGARLEGNAKFCADCGQKVDEEKNADMADVSIQQAPASVVKPLADINNSQSRWKNKDRDETLQEKIKREFYTHEGRLNRLAYFQRGFILGVAGFVFVALFGGIAAAASGIVSFLFGAVCVVGYIFIMIGSFMLAIRRCHDLDKSGWLTLTMIIPYVNIVAGLYVLFAKGTPGGNKYGPDPLAGKY